MAKDSGPAEIPPLQQLISDIEREPPDRTRFWRPLLADLRRRRAKFPLRRRARHRAAASRISTGSAGAAAIPSRRQVGTRGPRLGRMLLLAIGLVGALFASGRVPKR
jgi:hypothetical protein